MESQTGVNENIQRVFTAERAQVKFDDPEIEQCRQRAWERFSILGFPSVAHEEWRYTNVSGLKSVHFQVPDRAVKMPTGEEVEAFFLSPHGTRLTFVNSVFQRRISRFVDGEAPFFQMLSESSAGMKEDLKKGLGLDQESFSLLNAAFLQDALVIRIPRNYRSDHPIQILFLHVPRDPSKREFDLLTPRLLVIAEEACEVQLVEIHVGNQEGRYLSCPVSQIWLEEGAIVEHLRQQIEAPGAFHIGAMGIYQRQRSTYRSLMASLGAKLSRQQIEVRLNGEGAECVLNGIYVGNGDQHLDHHTVIDHATPNCQSHELYKGILNGEARGVFNGKILVRAKAQKTNAIQSNRTLLLSEKASIDTKPELQILADDVKCTHGATIGQLDKNALFYLCARGIPVPEAREMLVRAFAWDVIDRFPESHVRQALERQFLAKI